LIILLPGDNSHKQLLQTDKKEMMMMMIIMIIIIIIIIIMNCEIHFTVAGYSWFETRS
jgi:t-SNARE complex subunit (syntaxin)